MAREAALPTDAHPIYAPVEKFATDAQPLQGILLGCVLGSTLWMVAGLAAYYAFGYLRGIVPHLWWLLGVLAAIAAVEIARTIQNARPTSAFFCPRESRLRVVARDTLK